MTEKPAKTLSKSGRSYRYIGNCNQAAIADTGKVSIGLKTSAHHVPNSQADPSAPTAITAATTDFTGFPMNDTAQKLRRNGKPIAAKTADSCNELGTKFVASNLKSGASTFPNAAVTFSSNRGSSNPQQIVTTTDTTNLTNHCNRAETGSVRCHAANPSVRSSPCGRHPASTGSKKT